MENDELFEAVSKALDILAIQAAETGTATEDWITVSIPKLRVGATPLVNSALDAIENNPAHRKMFTQFVTDATNNPEFRESLKKSLRDPHVQTLVEAIIGGKKLPFSSLTKKAPQET